LTSAAGCRAGKKEAGEMNGIYQFLAWQSLSLHL
jgi:hypothetical protein